MEAGAGGSVNHKERVLGSLARRGYDRLPVMFRAEPVVTEALVKHLGVVDHAALHEYLGNDLCYVQPGYSGPEPRAFPDGSREIFWPNRGWPVPVRYVDVCYGYGTYEEESYRPFEDITDPAELARFDFPTADWIDYSTVKSECEQARGYPIFTGAPGILDFINGIAHGRGVGQVLMDIALEDPVYVALLEKKFAYHYETIECTLQAAGGLIDVVHTGEDLGIQRGLLISPRTFDRLFAAKYRAFFDMVHRRGAKTMMHCCGSVYDLLPRLIDVGLDILDVVQTSAAKMDLCSLRAEFGCDLSFCGTMCVQTTLPESTPDDIAHEVALRQELFADGGLILGPTHAIQPDTPLENILAMYRAAGSLAG